MTSYSTDVNKSKNTILLEEGKRVGEIIYDKYFTVNAKVYTDLQEFSIELDGPWSGKTILQSIAKKYFMYELKLKGGNVITVFEKWKDRVYFLKTKSIFNATLLLYNEYDELVATFKPKLNMKDYKYDYEIEITEELKTAEKEIKLFLLFLVYCAQRFFGKREQKTSI